MGQRSIPELQQLAYLAMQETGDLSHHGIKGMKWGVRRSQAELDREAGRSSEKAARKAANSAARKKMVKGFAKGVAVGTAVHVGIRVAPRILEAIGDMRYSQSIKPDAETRRLIAMAKSRGGYNAPYREVLASIGKG